MTTEGNLSIAALALASLAGCSNGSAISSGLPSGEIIGSVEISADVPASSCRVYLEGTPLGGRCNESGEFDLRNVPPGRWDLRIVTDDAAGALPAKRLAAAANPQLVTDLGAIRLAQPGAVGGLIRSTGGADLSVAIVAVPEIGAVTAPNANGGYLLSSVSPGSHEVVLLTASGTVIRQPVAVLPGKVTVGIDIDYSTATAAELHVTGRATRAGAGASGNGGITVELVESLDGKVIDQAQSADDGTFQLRATSGTYLVRARDGDNPARPIIPSVVVSGKEDVQLTSPLSLPAKSADLDGDGVPDASDPDIDGDGFGNDGDAFPYDPAEWLDSDKDGVGDRSDLRSRGGKGIDVQNPTPDTDGDGVLDFADNCPKAPNADLKDADGDGVGDACDDCPKIANPDQKDAVGNGIGDACRACQHNEDCGAGKLCQYGTCVACVDNAQCGDRVCDQGSGACVPCSASAFCTAPARCDLGAGRCVRCLASADCPPSNACVNGQCLAQCLDDSACPGGFCVGGGCVACRGNGDCPQQGQWCDRGACRAQCVVHSDCDGGRSCDPITHTCYAPCNGMCLKGQVCSASKCLQACDGSVPCAQGFKCVANACVPECAVDGDCANVRPFTLCSAGQCIPSGKCAYDADCPVSNLCAGGVCAPRPTVLTPGKGYACASPCDCRMGEACIAGFCAVEKAPRYFAVAGGIGASTDVTSPGDLGAALAAVRAGDWIAVRAGDRIGPAAFAIAQPGVTLAGGYQVCAPNRWVRDVAQRSTLHGATDAVLAVPGTNIQSLDHVTIENLDLVMDDWKKAGFALQATSAPNLTLSQLTATLAAPVPLDVTGQTSVAFSCDKCSDVTFSDLALVGLSAGDQTTIKLVDLSSGSGTLSRLSAGAVLSGTYYGVRVVNTVGPVTITGARLDGYEGGYGGWGVGVKGGAAGTVTLTGNSVGFGTYSNVVGGNFSVSGRWDPIYASGCPDLVVTGNTVDGRGIDESDHPQQAWYTHYGMFIEDSSGTVATNTVYPSVNADVNDVVGYGIFGPAGNIAFTENALSGGGARAGSRMNTLSAAGIAQGTLAISKASFTGGSSVGDSKGILLQGVGSFILVDSTVQSHSASNNSSTAIWIIQSVGRIERVKAFAGASSYESTVGRFDRSQVELYDNLFVAGSAGYASRGLWLSGGQLNVVGNTIDGANNPANPYSWTVYCNGIVGSSFDSNLVSGGNARVYSKIYNAGDSCVGLVSVHNNYFWAPSIGDLDPYDVTKNFATAGAMADKNGNVDAGAVGCYDQQNYQPPYYHIAAGSPCIDKGTPKPKRLDGSSIDKDIDGMTRTLGAAPDIGCSEKM